MKKIIKLVSIFIILNLNINLLNQTIVPDPVAPLYVDYPYTNKNNLTLTFRFKILNGSRFLYKQFLGIAFPIDYSKSINQFDLPFSDTDNTKYDCDLIVQSSISKTSIKLLSTFPEIPINPDYQEIEKNIIYCQHDDALLASNFIPSVEDTYILKIKLKHKININYVSTVRLFLSTTNSNDKIYLDQAYFVSDIGLYNNYPEIYKDNVPLSLEETIITVTTGKCSNSEYKCNDLYPENTFNIDLIIKSNTYIRLISDNYIVIELPDFLKTKDMKISTDSIYNESYFNTVDNNNKTIEFMLNGILYKINNDNKTLYSKLITNKNGIQFKLDNYYRLLLTNIEEILIPNRLFKITISSLTLNINKSEDIGKIGLYVYWKNTYTIFSYSYKNAIRLKKIRIDYLNNDNNKLTGISHPEFWDIYKDSAWPISFTFKFDSDLNNQSFLLIRHINYKKGVNQLNFISSTCDFSNNNSFISNYHGKRPTCYPLRNDLYYKENQSIANGYSPGSGVFFKLNNIVKDTYYNVIIWVMADACSGDSDNINDPSAENNNSSYATFKFSYTLYDNIDPNKLNEDRFLKSNILGQSSIISSSSLCWNTYIGNADLMYNTVITKSHDWTDKMLYKEITNFKLGNSNCSNCVMDDVVKYSDSFEEIFLYTENYKSSFLMLSFDIYLNSGLQNAGAYIPGPWYIDDESWKLIKGKLRMQFSKQWIEVGESECYLSWANYNSLPDEIYNTQKTLKISIEDNSNFDFKRNFISTKDNTINRNETFLSPSRLNNNFKYNGNQNEMIITSNISEPLDIINNPNNIGAYGDKWTYLVDASMNPAFKSSSNNASQEGIYSLYYFTNCVKLVNPLPNSVKSLYSYFDIQIKWMSVNQYHPEGITTKNIRLIKLYPEEGIFNNKSKIYLSNDDSNKNSLKFKNDFYYIQTLDTNKGICLIDISIENIFSFHNKTKSDTLILFLGHTILLETDYNDYTAEYPVISNFNKTNPISTFSISSSYILGNDNSYVKSKSNNIYNYFPRDSSSYMWFMGSILNITNVNNLESDNLLIKIPIYCPLKENQLNVGYSKLNLIVTSLATNKRFDNYSPIQNYLGYSNNNKSIIFKDVNHSSDKIINGYISRDINNKITTVYSDIKTNGIFNENTYEELSCQKLLLYFTESVNYNNVNRLVNNESSNYINLDSKNIIFYIEGFKYKRFADVKPTNKIYNLEFPTGSDTNYQLKLNKTTDKNENEHSIATYQDIMGFSCLRKTYNLDNSSSENTLITNLIVETLLSNNLNLSSSLRDTTINDNINSNQTINNSEHIKQKYIKSSFVIDMEITPFNNSSSDSLYLNDNNLTPFIVINKNSDYKYFVKDAGGSIIFKINAPLDLWKGMAIELNSELNFNKNTVCGVENYLNNIAYNCNRKSEKSIICNVPLNLSYKSIDKNDSYMNICCFNTYINNTEKQFKLDKVNIIRDLPDNLIFKKYYSNTLYSFSYSNNNNDSRNLVYTFNTNFGNLKDLNKSVNINNVKYFYVSQQNGIGKMIITLNLSRNLPRNLYIKLESNNMFYFNIDKKININCDAVFGTNFNSFEDKILIESCFHNLLVRPDQLSEKNKNNYIIIKLKNLIYKCSYFGKPELSIKLWPIMQYSDTTVNNASKFRILAYLNPVQGIETKLFDVNNLSFPNIELNNIQPPIVTKKVDFLKQLYLSHTIWSILNSIIFRIDLSSIREAIKSNILNIHKDNQSIIFENELMKKYSEANELSIYLPFSLFGFIDTEILCSEYNNYNNNNNYFSCSIDKDAVISILLPTLLINNEKSFLNLRISNLIIPDINNISNITTLMTINNINSENGDRTNIMHSLNQINTSNIHKFNVIGNLFVKNNNQIIKNPRELLSIETELFVDNNLFDYKYGDIDLNDAMIIAEFPFYYALQLSDINVESFIDIYLYDDIENADNYNINKPPKLVKKTIYNLMTINEGNTVYIYGINNIVISKSLYSINIKLSNLFSPSFKISDHSVSQINYAIISDKNYIVLKTINNLYNGFNYKLNPPIDHYIMYNKGIDFSFDNSKLVINLYFIDDNDSINNDSNTNNLNNKAKKTISDFTLYPGRYFKFSAQISSDIKKDLYVFNKISLSDIYFKTEFDEYYLSTIGKNNVDILLGTECGTLPGKYIVNFSTENKIDFFNLYPIKVNLITSNKTEIVLKLPKLSQTSNSNVLTIYSGFVYLIDYEIKNDIKPVDDIEINWNIDLNNELLTNSKNFNYKGNLEIKKGTINSKTRNVYPSILGTPNYKESTDQNIIKFKASIKNTCFKLSPNDSILVKLFNHFKSESAPDISRSSDNTRQGFYYLNEEGTNEEKKSINLNSIIYTFQAPPNSSYFVYCSLICFESEFLTDDQIINEAISVKNNLNIINKENNNYTSNHSYYYYKLLDSSKPHRIEFNNLIRGIRYKLKCVVTTTDYIVENRKKAVSIFNDYNDYSNSEENRIGIPIKTIDRQDTACFKLFFDKPDISIKLVKFLINSCQYRFIKNGYLNNGCITCTINNIYSNGFEIFKYNMCKPLEEASQINYHRLRNLLDHKTFYKSIKNDVYFDEYIFKSNMNFKTDVNASDIKESDLILTNIINNNNFVFLCITQNNNCPSNYLPSNNNGLSHVSELNEMVETLETPAKFKEFYQSISSNIETFIKAENVFVDNIKPDLNKLIIKDLNNNPSNQISWTSYFDDELECYWILNNPSSDIDPFAYMFLNCSEYKGYYRYCAKQKVNSEGVKVINILEDKLVPGTYLLWFFCKKDLPNSQTYSDITKVIGLKVEQANNGQTKSTTINPNDININEIKNTNIIKIIGNNYIDINIFMLLSIVVFYL